MHSERGFVRFMTTMLSYGFFGNIVKQSDSWRFFGPLRYNLSGFCQFILNSSYPAQLKIHQAPQQSSRGDGEECLVDERVEPETSSEEIKVEGQYKTINCLNMPCRCEKSKYGMSPSVNLGISSILFS